MRDWLKDLREEHGYTMKQMAEKLNITESYYSLIERGERQKIMDFSIASKLSVVFNMSVQQIFHLENPTS